MSHRRPTPARTGLAGTASALVLSYLAGIVALNQLLLRLQLTLGTVGAYAVIVCLVLLGTAAYVLVGRRFDHVDQPDDHDHVRHAEDQVDGQIAMLVRAGVEPDQARELVRDALVRAVTPRSRSTPIEDLLRRTAEEGSSEKGKKPADGHNAGLYL